MVVGDGGRGSLAGWQRGALARLRAVMAARPGTEKAIAEAYEAAVTGAGAALRSAREKAETAWTRAQDTIEVNARQATASVTTRHADEVKRHEQSAAATRRQALGQLLSAQEETEAALRDNAWMADAVFRAGDKDAADPGVLRARREAERAAAYLKESEARARRLAGPVVVWPETAPDAGALEAERAAAVAAGVGEGDAEAALARLAEVLASIDRRMRRLSGPTLHALHRAGLPWLLSFLALIGGVFAGGAASGWRDPGVIAAWAGGGCVGMLVLTLLPLRLLAHAGTRGRVRPLAGEMVEARALMSRAVWCAEAWRDQRGAAVAAQREAELLAARERRERKLERVRARVAEVEARLTEELGRLRAELDERLRLALEGVEAQRVSMLEAARADREGALAAAEGAHAAALASAEGARDEGLASLRARWRGALAEAGEATGEAERVRARCCPPWTDGVWRAWEGQTCAAGGEAPCAVIGRARLEAVSVARDGAAGGGGAGEDAMSEGLATALTPGLLLDFSDRASLLVEAGAGRRAEAIGLLNNAVLRLLTSTAPGKVYLTLIDPVGLGQSFAGLLRLSDFDERLAGRAIWSEPRQIERAMDDLGEHLQKVIQKYLRNEHPTLEAYNAAAGEIAEPYRLVVVADWPEGFADTSLRRLRSIVESGAKCGVRTLIHTGAVGAGVGAGALKGPAAEEIAALRAGSVVVRLLDKGGVEVADEGLGGLPVELEGPPEDGLVISLLDRVGERARSAGRVEVPFSMLAPKEGEEWSRRAAGELRVPLGRRGATRFQELALGRGTSQHALVAGKTGSGKSTLLHVMITNGALWHSPDELEYYLIDFKKGVEFKAYTGGMLPHARAIAIESDREFGLSVLRRLDDELKRRGELFRDLGVQSLEEARARLAAGAGGGDVGGGGGGGVPRTLLVIDEFQEFFTEDDKVAGEAALLMDRLVRQGRAFGMHVLLGSQTLSGAYSLARSTMGQMAVRVALQCSEADSYLILSEDNGAARLLTRPGEAIYNDANGLPEGNSPFQVAWMGEDVRRRALERVRETAARRGWREHEPAIVFEGNAPARVESNAEYAAWKAGRTATTAGRAATGGRAATAGPSRFWLGEAVSIKPATAAVLRRQAGANLLIVGQREETARGMVAAGLVGLGVQQAAMGAARGAGRVVVIDGTPADEAASGVLRRAAERVRQETGLEVRVVGVRGAEAAVLEFAAELSRREAAGLGEAGAAGLGDESAGAGEAAAWHLVVFGLQRARALRKREEFSSFSFGDSGAGGEGGGKGEDAGAALLRVLAEGPAFGLHGVVWCDTVGSLQRSLERRSLEHFGQRAILQMSATDSATLIETAEGSKLGLHRGLLYDEELGTAEKFRPYGVEEGDAGAGEGSTAAGAGEGAGGVRG